MSRCALQPCSLQESRQERHTHIVSAIVSPNWLLVFKCCSAWHPGRQLSGNGSWNTDSPTAQGVHFARELPHYLQHALHLRRVLQPLQDVALCTAGWQAACGCATRSPAAPRPLRPCQERHLLMLRQEHMLAVIRRPSCMPGVIGRLEKISRKKLGRNFEYIWRFAMGGWKRRGGAEKEWVGSTVSCSSGEQLAPGGGRATAALLPWVAAQV